VAQLIATGGKAGAGKDYVLEHLLPYEVGQGGTWMISGFGDLVRRELNILDPKEHRQWQQQHGQMRRKQDPNYWIKRAIEWAEWATTIGGAKAAGVTGVRFENEIEQIQDAGFRVGLVEAPLEVRLVRLEKRDGRAWTEAELNDVTETSLDLIPRWRWNFIWDNS
jgi:hypothetical protein